MKTHFLHFCLAIVLLNFSTSSQTVAVGKSDTEKTSALIEEILLELPMIDSKENRITISAMMIDLLWSRDEKRARQIAAETAELLKSELAPVSERNAAMQFPPLKYGDLRHFFLIILARNNPAFALEMRRYTLPQMPRFPPTNQSEKNQLRNWNDAERDLEQKIAFQIAAKDIAQARTMAVKSLALGVTDESLNTLRRFHIRDSAAADIFANELIEKLIAADFSQNEQAQQTAAIFLFQIDAERGVFGMQRSCNCPAKPLNLDSQNIRRLASKWLDFIIGSSEQNLSNDFLSAMPVLKKLLPERNAAIESKYAAIKKDQPKRVEQAQMNEQFFDDKTTPESLAETALKKEGNERFHLYRQAFVKAANNSKAALEKLLNAISTHPESEEKNWITDQINANLSGKTAEEGDLDKALEMSQKVVARDRRLGLLSFLAIEFLKKGDRPKAKQISDEIAALLDLQTKDKLPKAIVGYDVFSTFFRLFAVTDPERGFMLLENVLPESNNLFSQRSPMSDGTGKIDLQNLLRRNAYVLSSYEEPLKNLTKFDFERAKNLSKYFNNPEISITAKLILAQSMTDKNLGFGFVEDREEMIILKN